MDNFTPKHGKNNDPKLLQKREMPILATEKLAWWLKRGPNTSEGRYVVQFRTSEMSG